MHRQPLHFIAFQLEWMITLAGVHFRRCHIGVLYNKQPYLHQSLINGCSLQLQSKQMFAIWETAVCKQVGAVTAQHKTNKKNTGFVSQIPDHYEVAERSCCSSDPPRGRRHARNLCIPLTRDERKVKPKRLQRQK